MSNALTHRQHLSTQLVFVAACSTMLATQSRALAGGLGIGEVTGVLFMALTWRLRSGLPAWATLSMATLLAGYVVGATANLFSGLSTQLALRDFAALGFALVFAASAVAHLRAQGDPVLAISQALTGAVLVQLIPLLFFFIGIESPAWLTDSEEPGIPFLSRYIGFSDNPNQLGVLLCAYPLLAITAIQRSHSLAGRCMAGLGLLAAILLSVLVRSNTVFSAYILAGTLWAVLRFNLWDSKLPTGFRIDRLLVTLVFGVLAAMGFVLYALESIDKTESADANGRFPLWINALDGIAQSAFMGVGPGGQSGPIAPFQGDEAHNFLLDITLQGGLLSLLAYLFLLYSLLRHVLGQRSLLAACVILAVLTQQVSHYTARQPIAWLYLLLPLTLAAPRPRPAGLARQHSRPSGARVAFPGPKP